MLKLVKESWMNSSYAIGRLMVFHDGVWGSVCDDAFDTTDGNVACREMGFR